MRCFVAGAYGFLGRHIVSALVANGWTVTAGGRDIAKARRLMPGVEWVAVDFNRDIDAPGWAERLAGCDAVVNCVGVLQSGLRDDSRRIHVEATQAMIEGARVAGVRRVVHISALGADAAGSTAFARDKAAGDAAVAAIDIDTIILRPSLVYARDTYGGTRMLRALAGLPAVVPLFAGETKFEPIHADDLAQIVVRCLDAGVPARRTYEIGGPQVISMRGIVAEMRQWLGFGQARFIHAPSMLMRPLLWIGDVVGWLGAPSVMRSTTLAQALAMPRARSAALIKATGIVPRTMREALAAEPATAEDRLAARLGFALPALRIGLGAFWLVSGVVTLLPGPFAAARTIAEAAGVPPAWSAPAVAAMAMIDAALGLPMLIGVKVRLVALLQAGTALAYLLVLGLLVPSLFLDPLGSLVKIVPVLFASLVVAAASEER